MRRMQISRTALYDPVDWISRPIEAKDAALVKTLLAVGLPQHRLAALFCCNPGRIADIASGKKFPDVKPLFDLADMQRP